jgi:beta-glucosidase/6-phospho-beta-glucosidase/beta-galactosidase
MKALPKTFLWGVSTSSYQVEGDITNNDWDFFTRSLQISKRISTITKPSYSTKEALKLNYSRQETLLNSGILNIIKGISILPED